MKRLPPDAHVRVWFGKHKGQRWEDVPRAYLDWLTDNTSNVSAYSVARAEQKRRDGEFVPRVDIAGKHSPFVLLTAKELMDTTAGVS
jgi:hypothetical protein